MRAVFLKSIVKVKWGLLFLSAVMSCPVLAHHPMGGQTPATLWQGLLSGLAHPVIELDHLLFLFGIAVATATARIAPKQAMKFLVACVTAGAVGTAVRVSNQTVPFAESAVAMSLLLVGLWLWIKKLPNLVTAGLWVSGGFFHGYAYGEAVVGSEVTPLIAYLCGLALTQASLMIGAYLITKRFAAAAEKKLRPAMQVLSSFISLVALWLLWTAI